MREQGPADNLAGGRGRDRVRLTPSMVERGVGEHDNIVMRFV